LDRIGWRKLRSWVVVALEARDARLKDRADHSGEEAPGFRPFMLRGKKLLDCDGIRTRLGGDVTVGNSQSVRDASSTEADHAMLFGLQRAALR
jgi:hypothetical protein